MKRKVTITALCAMVFALCYSASAQQAKRVWRIGHRRTDQCDLTKTGSSIFALKSRLPSTYSYPEAVDAGGLTYYGAELGDSYRRSRITWTES
jgi:hypothetical protein